MPRVVAPVFGAAARHPALAVFCLALVARLIVAVFIAPSFSGSLVLDDSTYSAMAASKAAGDTRYWDEATFNLYEGTATLMVPLTALYEIVGPSDLAGRILVAFAGAGVAALLVLVSREIVPTPWAVAGGTILALFPSQVLWSSLILKDAVVWVLLVAIAVLAAIANRSEGWKLAGALVAIALLMLLLGYTRIHTVVLVAWALIIAVWFGANRQRMLRTAGVISVAATVPLVLGIGIFGFSFIAHPRSLVNERAVRAEGAQTAIVPKSAPTEEPRETRSPSGPPGEPPPAAPAPEPPSEGLASDLRHLPRGLFVALLEPVPWRQGSSRSLTYARLESPLWYALLVLALVGIPAAVRNRRVTAFPVLFGGAALIVFALTEGNIGTAYRHRGELVWVVALLAVLGAREIAARRKRVAQS